MEDSSIQQDFKGKRVFFLYPHSVIQNEMVGELIKNEFEIYLLPDHHKASNLFRQYPDSIVFINIDEILKEPEWEAFIKGLQGDSDLTDLKIGILTYNNSPELAQKYLMDLMVPCGFIKLSLGLRESTDIILKVLEANEAKGRRRFLRVRCPEGTASLNLKQPNKVVTGAIIDVSSVGMAVVFDHGVTFPSRTYLQDMQLRLRNYLCMVTAIVMGTRQDDSGRILYILLFDSKLPTEARQKIRSYIQLNLQTGIEQEIKLLASK